MQRSVEAGIEDILANIGALAVRELTGPHDLESALRRIYHAIHDVDLARHDRAGLKHRAPHLMQALFSARMALRDKIGEWHEKGYLLRPSEIALRDVFRVMRYANDMLGELMIGNAARAEGEPAKRAFTGREYNTQVHPRHYNGRNIPFRSGDVLLVRGFAHNSAAIARIGDVDTQFSHTAIIYVDEAGAPWVVEALIEEGSVINSLEHVLDHDMGRAVLYRYKDDAIAARAAKLAYERVVASKGWGRHIPYDFSMRLKGRRSLFCAKLVQQAFLDATGGKVSLPLFKTRFDQRNARFFKSIGVRVKETFAPTDLDLDPRFDLVAEWQDYRATSTLRRQDMIMTKFFEWMETRGYTFKPDMLVRLIAILGRLSSYLSKGVKDLLASVVPKVPRNMPARTIATIVMLHKTAEEVTPALRALSEDHIRMTGRPIHPKEYLAHLERLREVSGGKIGYLKGPA